ncbi:MAG: glycosyltransferase family 2 protein, partial [Candidatus Chisholmbacteria bacterium]|nr:glycosyltransferase family 2 protein [Candidatus Chisholmbacteria bacterium]
ELKKCARRWEIIVVDDGSKDNTAAIVKNIMKEEPKVRLIQHLPNLGYGASIKTGLNESKYKYICYTDSDGQFDFKEIYAFIAALNHGADMAIGFRVKRTDTLYRRFMAQILHLVGIVLFGINVKDVDCGFKVFKKAILDKIGPLKTASAITETELVTRTKKAGFKIQQLGVRHHSRPGGEQTGGKPEVVFKAAIEGLRLWMSLMREKVTS